MVEKYTEDFMKWTDRDRTKKGDYGEFLVDNFLESKGFYTYAPTGKKAHPFDRFAYNQSKNIYFALDVKTKAKRKKYSDTGIDIRFLDIYKKFSESTNQKFYIFFVDEELKKIYGNSLDLLEQKYFDSKNNITYPYHGKGDIVYFPLKNCTIYQELTDSDCSILRNHTQKQACYLPNT